MSRYYTDEFKENIVKLRLSGKSAKEIKEEYKLSDSTISTWVRQYQNSGAFSIKANLTQADVEIRTLKKENKRLKMEVDILKQAALILSRKSE